MGNWVHSLKSQSYLPQNILTWLDRLEKTFESYPLIAGFMLLCQGTNYRYFSPLLLVQKLEIFRRRVSYGEFYNTLTVAALWEKIGKKILIQKATCIFSVLHMKLQMFRRWLPVYRLKTRYYCAHISHFMNWKQQFKFCNFWKPWTTEAV